jgi:hypothetical protein
MRADNVELALETLERGEGYVELTIEQFRDFYHKIINSKILNDHTVFAVFIEDRILIRFPEKSDAKFVIRKDKKDTGVFSEKDMDFIANLEPMGTYEGGYKFISFLKKELRLNWRVLIGVFFVSFVLFFTVGNVDMLRKVNELILVSITIFISIFLLFTISQGRYKNEFKFMKSDILYKFFQNDKYIAKLAIILIFLSIATVAFSYVDLNQIMSPNAEDISFSGGNISETTSPRLSESCGMNYQIIFFLPILTSFSIVILAICYLSISQYYFERMKFIRLLSASEELLNDRLQKYKKINDESVEVGLDH